MTRRSLLRRLAQLCHGAAAVLAGAPVLRLVTGTRSRRALTGAFQRIAPLSATQTDRPVRITVMGERTDAFTHYPPGPIGVVWVVRNDRDALRPRVRCFQSVCPHLGCAIDFAGDRDVFFCPCHASEFASNGSRNFGPSPRDMDELIARLSAPDKAGQRWVEIIYAEFKTGTQDQLPRA